MDSVTSSYASSLRRRVPRALIATLGHELRTPLTSIRGYIEALLESELDPPTTRRFLETARRETLRLGRMVDGMLCLPAAGAAQRDGTEGCDVVTEIDETIEMLAPVALARRVTIRRRLPAVARARVGRDACVHAVANLLENAIKHGSRGGAVDIECVTGERFIAIAVDDDGQGVVDAARDAIFELGVRASAPSRRGNGIGLAVVKAISERSGGDVRVERSALGGARFVVRFPAG